VNYTHTHDKMPLLKAASLHQCTMKA